MISISFFAQRLTPASKPTNIFKPSSICSPFDIAKANSLVKINFSLFDNIRTPPNSDTLHHIFPHNPSFSNPKMLDLQGSIFPS